MARKREDCLVGLLFRQSGLRYLDAPHFSGVVFGCGGKEASAVGEGDMPHLVGMVFDDIRQRAWKFGPALRLPLLSGAPITLPAAAMISKERLYGFGLVVIEAVLSLVGHGLVQQGPEPATRKHHRRRCVH